MTVQTNRSTGLPTRAFRVVGVLAASAAALSIATSSARANLLAYEGFDYGVGSSIISQVGGFGWANAWQTNGSQGSSVTISGNLGYVDTTGHILYASGNSALFTGSATGTGAAQPNRDFVFPRGTNGTDGVTSWVSMVLYRQGQTTNNTGTPGNTYPRGANVSLFNTTGAEKLAIGNGSGTASNTVAMLPAGSGANVRPTQVTFGGQIDFVIVRIDHTTGATNDNAFIWVNPANLSIEPNISTALTNSLNEFDFSFGRIRPFAGGLDAANSRPAAVLGVDEIRVGTTFADVAPWIPVTVPEPSVVVLSALGGLGIFLLRRRKQ